MFTKGMLGVILFNFFFSIDTGVTQKVQTADVAASVSLAIDFLPVLALSVLPYLTVTA